MATPAWQTRPLAPAGSVQQPPLVGPQSHWGAPGTVNSQVQGLPRPPYAPQAPSSSPYGTPGPPGSYGQSPTSGPPSNYGQLPASGPPSSYSQSPASGPPSNYAQSSASGPPSSYGQALGSGPPAYGQSTSAGPPSSYVQSPASGPPSSYGQSAATAYGAPTQANSGSGGPVSAPSPPNPPGSSAGMLLSGSYATSPSLQSVPSYGPPLGSFPGNRWQPPAMGSTPSTPPQTMAGRVTSEGSNLPGGRPAIPPSGPVPTGVSQATPPPVTAPSAHLPQYQQYSSGPGPGPQPLGSWIPPQQASQMQQLAPFPKYANNFQVTYPSHLHPVQDISGTGPPPPPGASYGPVGDPSVSKAVPNPSSGVWGHQPPYGGPASFSLPSKEMPMSSNGRPNAAEPAAVKTVPSGPQGSTEVIDTTVKGETGDVPDVWTAHKTANGAIYYYNSIKGQSTYEKPQGFKGEAEKVTAQPTPVSWERLNGTDWALVTTNDGKTYYYNTKSRATSWQVPPEVVDLRKKQAEEAAVKSSTEVVAAPGTTIEKSTVSFTLSVPAAATGGREAIGHKGSVTNSALDLIKKKLQDPGVPSTSTTSPPLNGPPPIAGSTSDAGSGKLENIKEKVKDSNVEAFSSDSSSESDEEDPGPTKEERVIQFKEMLKEKGIAPFSKWEKELPKIIFDVRFKAIPSHTERRSIFEHYVRTRADEERKEKRAAQKAALEGFKQLLDEAKEFSHNTTYEHFARTWGKDSRFEALDRKDREALLNERVLPLRKAEEERVKAEHAVSCAGFRAMLMERTDINITTRWSKVRESLRNDQRYSTVKREEREGLFNAYLTELVSAEQEAERAAKAKRDEEEKVKEREREIRKRKEREEQELERVRIKARRKDAVNAYQALLTEKIKDPEASWTEARPKLEKDPLGRATNPELELADRERLFREHTNDIFERCVREYRLLLADVITIEAASKNSEQILTSWSEAKKILKIDPRYSRMPRRDRESWWRRYAEDVQRRMKVANALVGKDDKVVAGNGTKAGAPLESSRRSPGSKRSASRR